MIAEFDIAIALSAAIYAASFASSVAVSRSHDVIIKNNDALRSHRNSARALRLFNNRERVLLGLHVIRIATAVISGLLWGAQSVRDQREGIFLLSGILLVVVIIVFTQVAKAFVQRDPEKALIRFSGIVEMLYGLSMPLVYVVRVLCIPIVKFLKLDPPTELDVPASLSEISSIIERSEEAGHIDSSERELIERVFTASDTVAREIMTPRKDIVSVGEGAQLDAILSIAAQEKVSRIVVVRGTIDTPLGVILVKDLIPLLEKGSERKFVMSEFIRPILFVPNSKKVDELLEEFRSKHNHLAVVLDEDGTVDGVVTLEDVVEEIVGEIYDEFDDPAKEQGFRKTKSGDLVVSGQSRIQELDSPFDLSFPAGEYDTVGGYIMHQLGRLPTLGEALLLQGGVKLIVESISHTRIISVRLHKSNIKGV
jgi:putative hemolysin